MDRLLTVREVQELLNVDRVTVYRMLKDGRLGGIKIGHQWRFAPAEIETLLADGCRVEVKVPAPSDTPALPLHCVQAVQNAFAAIASVGVLTVSPQGEPLSEWSNPCRFCALVQTSEAGRQRCMSTWARLASQGEVKSDYVTCHAGLQCLGAPVEVGGAVVATLIAGQFYAAPHERKHEALRLTALATALQLDASGASAAVNAIPVLDCSRRRQLVHWASSIARAIAAITTERAALLGKLHSIAAIIGPAGSGEL